MNVKAKICQRQWMSKAMDVKAKICQSKRLSKERSSFSHLTLSDFEGSLAEKLRFHIFNCWNLKDVLHERLEIAGERNVLFLYSRTKRVSLDVWGSLSGGRFRNTLGSTGIIVNRFGVAASRLR